MGSLTVVSRGEAHDASRLPTVLAVNGEDIVGLATFRIADAECELVMLDALHKGEVRREPAALPLWNGRERLDRSIQC